MSVANEMELVFDSRAENEGFARVAVGAFFTQLNPTLEEVCDVKTAVSEAVTNAIIHGYNEEIHKVKIKCKIVDTCFYIEVIDTGTGIENIKKAMEPLYTTKADMDRAGMGFAFMEAFMDQVEVISVLGEGSTIKMKKKVNQESENGEPWIKQSL